MQTPLHAAQSMSQSLFRLRDCPLLESSPHPQRTPEIERHTKNSGCVDCLRTLQMMCVGSRETRSSAAPFSCWSPSHPSDRRLQSLESDRFPLLLCHYPFKWLSGPLLPCLLHLQGANHAHLPVTLPRLIR